MSELWITLAPLIVASALLPLQTLVTLLLVRSSLRSAVAWVAGMTTVRLIQGVVFGVLISAAEEQAGPASPRYFTGALLLLLAGLLYMKALRKAVGAEDEDAPPPGWVEKAASMSPTRAFATGAGFMTISVKFLVFTLGAIGAITEAHMAAHSAALTFLLFVLLGQSVPFAIVALGRLFLAALGGNPGRPSFLASAQQSSDHHRLWRLLRHMVSPQGARPFGDQVKALRRWSKPASVAFLAASKQLSWCIGSDFATVSPSCPYVEVEGA